MTKKRGENLDTAFLKFWNDTKERGASMYRFKSNSLYEIDTSIDRLAQYAFFKGWEARSKRERRKKKK